MRFLSFDRHGSSSFGVIFDSGVVDLGARHPDIPDLRAALRMQCLSELAAEAVGIAPDFDAAEMHFLPTIPNPEKIICIGINYANRNGEYADDSPAPAYPSVFMRTRESVVGHERPILKPPESDQLDYEGEIVLVVGKEGRRIPRGSAAEHIAGLTLMNEGSVRDYLRHGKFNVTPGKNFEHSGALGPWIVTADELEPMSELRVMARVNGEERQNDTTGNLIFPFDYLISYLSTFFRLKPGDLIATGTPTGAGARLDPPRYLKDGDVTEIEVPGIGKLRNPIRGEKL
jgi:5-carboxymethyl-2-hydroxymuconate isomerase